MATCSRHWALHPSALPRERDSFCHHPTTAFARLGWLDFVKRSITRRSSRKEGELRPGSSFLARRRSSPWDSRLPAQLAPSSTRLQRPWHQMLPGQQGRLQGKLGWGQHHQWERALLHWHQKCCLVPTKRNATEPLECAKPTCGGTGRDLCDDFILGGNLVLSSQPGTTCSRTASTKTLTISTSLACATHSWQVILQFCFLPLGSEIPHGPQCIPRQGPPGRCSAHKETAAEAARCCMARKRAADTQPKGPKRTGPVPPHD